MSRLSRSEQILVLEAGRADRSYWRDLWAYREVFFILAWRDISVRYKQTVIGVLWAILRPLLSMAVFTVVFGKLANLPSEGAAPYALMVLAGMLPWTFVATALSDSSNSLVTNANLVGKVYFPRLIIPGAAIVVAAVDLLISFAIMAAAMAWYRFIPNWHLLLLPVMMLFAFLAALGPGLLITSLNVKYRDFRYIIPFAIQLGMYVSPVGFSSNIVPEQWRLLYALNPVVGVIDGFRWCLLGSESQISWPAFSVSLSIAGLFLWLGLRQFRRMEAAFADHM